MRTRKSARRSGRTTPTPIAQRQLALGLPKGSLQEATVRLFDRAGFKVVISDRSYTPSIDDPDFAPMLLRAQEMARYVGQGVLDCGITGNDWILENGSSVARVAELVAGKYSQANYLEKR